MSRASTIILAVTIALLILGSLSLGQQRPLLDEADQPIRTSAQNPDAVAVVVGIQDYEHRDVPDVEFAINDAEAVRRVLQQTLGYSESRILFLTNGQASIGRLKPLFRQQLPARVIPGRSDVFIYYSGHGAPNVARNEGYLIPWDYDPQYVPTPDSAYSLKELYADLTNLRARSVTVILEACFSGQTDSDKSPTLIKDASPLTIRIENPTGMLPNDVVVSASGSSEIATWYNERQHGLMTYFWLRAMRGEAGDPQGRLTPELLREYLQANVPRVAQQLRGRPQKPEVTTSGANKMLAQLPVSALRTGDARVEQRFGSLEIFIDMGGDLSVDGVLQGTIPAGSAFVRRQFPAGPHQIEIRKNGFQAVREELIVLPGQQAQKVYRLAANVAVTPAPAPGQNAANGINGGYVGSDRWFSVMRQSAANQAMLASLGRSRDAKELPADYVEFAGAITFPNGNPFPDKKLPDLRIVSCGKNADPVERAPFVDDTGGFYTVFKKGQTYDVFWMYYPGGREQFATITIPADSGPQRRLEIAYSPSTGNNPSTTGQAAPAPAPAVQRTPRPPDADKFDTSGLPPRPTTFEEQLIMDELSDPTSARAHERLARYYESKGDTKRANAEYEKARYWRDPNRQ